MDNELPKNKEPRQVDEAPFAAALIVGHRDFGYCLETALADVIDNSISDGASKIELFAETSGDAPWIAIADDGCGMRQAKLIHDT